MLPGLNHIAVHLQIAYSVLALSGLAWLFFPRLRQPSWIWNGIGFISVVTIAFYHLASPWFYQHDFNAALSSIAARNYLERGILYTLGAELWNGGTAQPIAPHFHVHHPPLISWWVTLFFAVFGIHEWAARLAIIAPFFIALACFIKYFRHQGPLPWILAAAIPAFAYYARMPRHEPLTILLIFLGLALYLKPPTQKTNLGMGLLSFLIALSSWGGCLFITLVFIASLLTRQRSLAIATFCGAGCGGFVLLFILGAHSHWNFVPLLEQFGRRSFSTASESGPIQSTFTWFLVIGKYYAQLIGPIPTLLALIGALTLRDKKTQGIVALLLVFATSLILILRQWAYVHEYSVCYFAVPILILACHGIDFLLNKRIILFILLAASLYHGLEHVNLRHRKLIGYQHAYKLGLQINEISQPDDVVFTAYEPPSPIFLYYADRDYLVWPDPVFDTGVRPDFFIQFRGEIPKDVEMLRDYRASEVNPRILKLANDQVE